jgi:hypothetical protein
LKKKSKKFDVKFSVSYAGFSRVALVAICALTVAAVPLYWLFASPSDFIGLEKRYRAAWPEFSVGQFLSGKWGERAETWMKDLIPARDFLVGVDSYVWYLCGRQTARDVFVDGAGGLVDAPAEFSAEDLTKRLDKIAAFAASLDAGASDVSGGGQGVDTVGTPPDARPGVSSCAIVIPPDPGYVARLPLRLKNLYGDDDIAETVMSYFETQSVDDGAVFEFVDLRQAFLKEGSGAYYRTDHHWNGNGAYVAYAELGGVLGYDPLPKEAFTVETVKNFYGSVYAKSGLWLTGPDTLELWSPPCRLRATIVNDAKEPDVRDTLFFDEYLTDWDMYSTFLGGINGLTIIDNLDGGADDTLFIVKDSYANSLIPLLAVHYKRIAAVDLRRFRGAAGELLPEYGTAGGKNVFLFVYSTGHIMGDPDLLWLR